MAYHSNGVSGGGNGVGHGSGGAGGGYSGDERESRSGGGDDRPDSDLTDKPIYLLEHLATFTVNKDTGIVYPADGMRRLLQLEKTTGIWSQKMQLCLDNQWVLIMDYETGNIIERFPASLIQEPTAFTGNDPMEMYNNILVFIVSGGSASRSEMHIFQSQSISAVHLVEDLKQLRNGKLVTQHRDTIPPLPMKQSMSVLSAGSPSAAVMGVGSGYHHESDSELGGINDETSSTSSDKYERDVTVLNHCFDDIEKFIARLQHAAAASRELERRRRNRKSKKKDPGEGLLTLRTRPPHEKEFIDIFAKFKLSFNLLAKLKAHIHDPNAPELVHFLFTPLALIVEASSDTYYESHLPGRVINPLLTREAVNLLINCVTSKETELWRSLGDAWTIPRDQWKGHIGSYHPVFFDGWSPDYPVVDELEHPTSPTNIKRRIDAHHSFVSGATSALAAGAGNSDRADYEYEGPGSPGPSTHHHHHHAAVAAAGVAAAAAASGNRDFSVRSDISIDSIERNGAGPSNTSNTALMGAGSGQQQSEIHAIHHHHHSHLQPQPHDIDAWIEDLQTRGAKIVQVTYPRTANNDKELTVVRGEYLEILDDSRKWWKARNSRGQVAHVPHTIVTPYNYNDSSTGGGTGGDVFNNPLYSQNYSNNGTRQAELIGDRYTQSIEPSPSSNLMPASNSADWVRNKHIEKSQSFGSESSNDEDDFGNDGSKRRSYYNQYRHQKMLNGVPTAPPPPPPPPPNAPTTPVAVHSASFPRSNTNISVESTSSPGNDAQNEMQEELKQVLTLFREKRPNLDILKTPEIYINASSSASEVEEWLRAKGFSEKVVRKLHGLNGNHLFSLKRDTLEDFCGAEEGKRLTSQITIQRNVSGYKTARTSELQALLARARQKTEQQETSEGTFKENIFN